MNYRHWISENFDKETDVAFITGGSSGIGFSYAELLVNEGCHCILLSNDYEELAQAKNRLMHTPDARVDCLFCDLANLSEVKALESALAGYQIKILVNCAGYGQKGDFLSHTLDQYVHIVMVNSISQIAFLRMLLPKMREMNSGLVISVASINVVTPIPKNAVYTGTKYLNWACALAISEENRDYNIVFQVLLPGTTDTPFHIKQGAVPRAITMQPMDVARNSLNNLDALIYIPNWIDRLTYPFVYWLPVRIKMKIAAYSLKKRLGI